MPLEEVPTSTEAPPASDAVVAEAPTRAEHTRIDDEAGIVTFRGMGYSFDTLPDASKRRAGLIGLARLLRESDGDVWDKLKSGDFVVRVAAKPKELDNWRMAYAHALAEETVKADGGRVKIGNKETPEFSAALEVAMAKARDLDRSSLAKLKVIPAVVAHHARLSGAPTVSLASIVGG